MSFVGHVHRAFRRYGLGAICATSISLANSKLGRSGRITSRFRPVLDPNRALNILKQLSYLCGGFHIFAYWVQHINSYLVSLPRSSLTACLAHFAVYLHRMRLRCKLFFVFIFVFFVLMGKRKCPRNLASAWEVRKASQQGHEHLAALQTSPGVILTCSHFPESKFLFLDRFCGRYRVFRVAHGQSMHQLICYAMHQWQTVVLHDMI
jgi:hypothetical protein